MNVRSKTPLYCVVSMLLILVSITGVGVFVSAIVFEDTPTIRACSSNKTPSDCFDRCGCVVCHQNKSSYQNNTIYITLDINTENSTICLPSGNCKGNFTDQPSERCKAVHKKALIMFITFSIMASVLILSLMVCCCIIPKIKKHEYEANILEISS